MSNMEVRVLHFGGCSVISGLGALKKANRMWKKDVFFPNSLGKPKAYRQAVGVQLGVLTGVMREWLNQTGMLSFCASDGYYLSFINK